ncbi:hypothetical protein Sste5346_006420 [Sporothrix stenoceras]|uniref:Enoyl reductase (ER) domain-containing protein n=1 Tax=Sporothrix stenoceras TaxID=5173 RepID=A0ABR3YYX0_9PEZI
MPIKAAVCEAAQTALVVKDVDGPVSPLAKGSVIVRTAAVAINPFDCAMQAYGSTFFPFLSFPAVFGEDVAGTIEEVADDVTDFQVGDRVAGLSQRQGFQERAVLLAHMAYKVPPSISWADAATLPMGVVVSIFGLFHKDYLNLRMPSVAPSVNSPPAGGLRDVVLVWGASTSVGSQAVQLAAAAGYEVVTTASPKRFDYAKSIGATHVFDYSSPSVADDIKKATEGRRLVGAFCNGGIVPGSFPGIIRACADVVRGTARPFLALTMVMPAEGVPEGVEGKFIAGVHDDPDFSLKFLGADGYIPRALAAGTHKIAPEARIAGHGLEAVQGAMDTLKAGVSATKVVVTL